MSFCVIDKNEVVQETLTTHYRSAIVFGRARFLEDDDEKKYALDCLAAKYSPDFPEKAQNSIARSLKKVGVAEINIEHMTGKVATELVNTKEE